MNKTTFSKHSKSLGEFKEQFNKSGDSVLAKAYYAAFVTDDRELSDTAKNLLTLEDVFVELLLDRGIEQ
jgi:hypothetical protein